MSPSRTSSGLLLILLAAAAGFLLLAAPSWLAAQYEAVSAAGPFWVRAYFATLGLGAVLLGGAALTLVWRLSRRRRAKLQRRSRRAKAPSQLSLQERAREVDENLAAVADLERDPAVSPEVRRELEQLVRRVAAKRRAQRLEIVAFGTVSSGKSALLNALAGRTVFPTDPRAGTTLQRAETPWPGADRVTLVDTPGLGEVGGAERTAQAAAAARDADLVLLVADGPLRDSEHALLEQLGAMEKRVLVCLNKGDWYDASERRRLLEQLAGQAAPLVRPEDVVAVRAEPVARRRVRVGPDGEAREEEVPEAPDIGPLAERMLAVVQQDGRDLLLANLLLQSRGLVEEAKRRVQEGLDRRAWQIIDRYAWAAGSAAAVSPLPLLDLAAGGAVTTKMVLELGRVYRQEPDLDTVVALLAQLGKNLLAILGTSAAGPAVASAVASLLKTVPGAGTIAGGLLQGVVQALVTRWIGAVFVEYYRNEMQTPEGGLTAAARRQWERLTGPAELQRLVRAARDRLEKPSHQEPHGA